MTRLIVDDGGQRRAFKLNDGRLTVGSGAGATLRLTADGVAEAHADLVVEQGRVRLAPRPGVLPPLVAGVPAKAEVELRHDAAVKIGGATLTVQYEDAPAPAPAPTPAVPSAAARRSGSGRRPGRGAGGRAETRASRRPGRPQARRSGLPGWALALILLAVAGLALVFVPRLLTSTPGTEDSVRGSMVVARRYLAEGNLELVRQRVEGVDVAALDAATRAEYEAVLAEYQAAKAQSELDQENMKGNVFLNQQLKNFEAQRLRGEAKRPQARVFLKRCQEFKQRWPQHPELDWVERMERRFEPIAELGSPPSFEDVAFEAEALTWANPRDYRTAIPLLQRYADEEASVDERAKALALIDELVEQRNEWFTDRMEQARFEFARGNEGQSVEWLRILIVYTGEPTMAERAASELVLFEGLEGWLEAYQREKPEAYAELAKNPVIADYVREHGLR